MGLFDEIGNSVIVSTLKQFLNRTDHEIFVMDNPHGLTQCSQRHATCRLLQLRC